MPDTSGPAFPTYDDAEFGNGQHALFLNQSGMSLRQWYAGQALAGLMEDSRLRPETGFKHLAARMFQIADAMVEASAE